MNITVSISDFRQHISDYVSKAKAGHKVILKNGKKDERLVQLVGQKKFNPETFGKALSEASGIFTAENHPEWKTKDDIIRWVKKQRLASDRKF